MRGSEGRVEMGAVSGCGGEVDEWVLFMGAIGDVRGRWFGFGCCWGLCALWWVGENINVKIKVFVRYSSIFALVVVLWREVERRKCHCMRYWCECIGSGMVWFDLQRCSQACQGRES